MMDLLHLIEKVSVLVFLVSSMLVSGLGLTWQLLITPLRQVRLVLLVLGLNFIVAPALAWLVTMIIPLERGHAIALILLGGAAGAPFFPKLVEKAGGNLALAASMMALLTCGTIIFMPLALPWLIPGLEADAWSIASPLVLLILLPLVIGLVIRSCSASSAARISPLLAKLSSLSLLMLFLLLIALNVPALLGVLGSGAILAGLIYLIGLFIAGWFFSMAEGAARGVLALAIIARNFGAALVPASNSFNDPSITVALIVNAILGIVFAFLAAKWVRSKMTSGSPQ
jgi:predicted Na+-dependent transporter